MLILKDSILMFSVTLDIFIIKLFCKFQLILSKIEAIIIH